MIFPKRAPKLIGDCCVSNFLRRSVNGKDLVRFQSSPFQSVYGVEKHAAVWTRKKIYEIQSAQQKSFVYLLHFQHLSTIYICITILKIYKRLSLTIYSFIVKLSKRIQVRSTVSGASQSRLTEDKEFFHKTFPQFVWLLRDVTQGIPRDCKDIKDYFLKKVRLIKG